ncbi:unnamed protein product [Peniophora sp. CBMAI 1063]|nr:unnamed protein product [Peniophora sp. CBMAI 1063]
MSQYLDHVNEHFKMIPKPDDVYSSHDNAVLASSPTVICPPWLNDALVSPSNKSISCFTTKDLMNQGFYAAYLYICRERSNDTRRSPMEMQACDDIHHLYPWTCDTIEKTYPVEFWPTGLSVAEMDWAIAELNGSFQYGLAQFQQVQRNELIRAVRAHERMLTAVANWAASEHIWADLCERDGSKERERALRYTTLYETLRAATEHLKSLWPRSSRHNEGSCPYCPAPRCHPAASSLSLVMYGLCIYKHHISMYSMCEKHCDYEDVLRIPTTIGLLVFIH